MVRICGSFIKRTSNNWFDICVHTGLHCQYLSQSKFLVIFMQTLIDFSLLFAFSSCQLHCMFYLVTLSFIFCFCAFIQNLIAMDTNRISFRFDGTILSKNTSPEPLQVADIQNFNKSLSPCIGNLFEDEISLNGEPDNYDLDFNQNFPEFPEDDVLDDFKISMKDRSNHNVCLDPQPEIDLSPIIFDESTNTNDPEINSFSAGLDALCDSNVIENNLDAALPFAATKSTIIRRRAQKSLPKRIIKKSPRKRSIREAKLDDDDDAAVPKKMRKFDDNTIYFKDWCRSHQLFDTRLAKVQSELYDIDNNNWTCKQNKYCDLHRIDIFYGLAIIIWFPETVATISRNNDSTYDLEWNEGLEIEENNNNNNKKRRMSKKKKEKIYDILCFIRGHLVLSNNPLEYDSDFLAKASEMLAAKTLTVKHVLQCAALVLCHPNIKRLDCNDDGTYTLLY